MDAKERLSGFKALLASSKSHSHYLEETDGSHQLWGDLSPEGRLQYIARDAAYYDVSFEQFVDAVRKCIDPAKIEEAALRLAMRCIRELHDLEKLFPDDRGTESTPLIDRVREHLGAKSPAQDENQALTCDKLATHFDHKRSPHAAERRAADGNAAARDKSKDIER